MPEDFTADHYTRLRNNGGLIFVTVNMFQTFTVIEMVIEGRFQSIGQIYEEETFQQCIDKISTELQHAVDVCHVVGGLLFPFFLEFIREKLRPK